MRLAPSLARVLEQTGKETGCYMSHGELITTCFIFENYHKREGF